MSEGNFVVEVPTASITEDHFTESPLDFVPLPEWDTSTKLLLLSMWLVFRRIYVQLFVVLVVAVGIGLGKLFINYPEINTVVFSATTFILTFLLQARMRFSTDRYVTGTREFVCFCTALQSLTHVVCSNLDRNPTLSGKASPWQRHLAGPPRADKRPWTAQNVLEDAQALLKIFPSVVLHRFSDRGNINFNMLSISPQVMSEIARFQNDPLQGLMSVLSRRLSMLLESEAYPRYNANILWRVYTEALNRLGMIVAVRRTPAPQIFRDFLLAASFLYLFAFPLALYHTFGWFTLVAMFFLSLLILGILAVANGIREPFDELRYQPFIRVDLSKYAQRVEQVIDECFFLAMEDIKKSLL
mmetsp:Transcript_10777/g.18866  ORF Transcript_10777/g.18866 Transcript_10777/m.18866 type:complete len:357 (-) Transcript_10777:51-1121(-)|eukprot:CAMPEP_0196655114 /NCGR_PEP_ID=MMETSP1086-20130531/4865_1 /TAXON_ID=77921 /ORGANISM="Cyanoptyche  gloeocystis , Strain SAG4.97" /LENGTH=356 /DNA_ID=CAMNT_0041987249 /DNA_START=266 /DNA_END=1336 /DNA_ORIENTATION=-